LRVVEACRVDERTGCDEWNYDFFIEQILLATATDYMHVLPPAITHPIRLPVKKKGGKNKTIKNENNTAPIIVQRGLKFLTLETKGRTRMRAKGTMSVSAPPAMQYMD
jgi:hypothetical protein